MTIHDPTEMKRQDKLTPTSSYLPPDSAWLFPEYEFKTIGLESHQGVIIERILERGTWAQLRWLFAMYGEERVAAWVQRHGFRLLSRRSFALWRLVFGIADGTVPEWVAAAKEIEAW